MEEKSEMMGGQEASGCAPHSLLRGRKNGRRQWLWILESNTFIIPRRCPLPPPPVAPEVP